MTHPPAPGPAAARRADQSSAQPQFGLRDIVQALCAGLPPSAEGLELILDRLEATR
ncbi:hypothetical protein [Phaeovulum sp. NW3]|uniref:hypothetical protein n=1 Tax=Phaeovulum sp. NW3 TaxID=2934933 RepID=UPI002020DA80|nr:hypothetical protein [Phaeovulum sp. NW3]MCL7464883.1 hypothetical protein [Phaeovulum sp. NW3]